MEAEPPAQDYCLTSTQIGAIGESLVAAGLMVASGGRLAPFKPLADDDGIDLLLFDKLTGTAIPLQVKSRTGLDRGGTVQFDVRLKTFTPARRGYLLAALMDGVTVRAAWLIPAKELAVLAKPAPGKLVVIASPRPVARDKYRPYRHENLNPVARTILADIDKIAPPA